MKSRILIVLWLSLAISACASVPFDYPREDSFVIADTSNTSLGREVAEWTAAHSGLSGFYPLLDGMDSFGARLHLIDVAERSIDLQYFLM